MLIRIFKSNQLFPLVAVLPLLILVFWVPSFIGKVDVNVVHPMPIYAFIYQFLSEFPVFISVVSMLLVYAQALLLNSYVNSYELLPNRSNLPALIYIIIMCSFKSFLAFHPLILANFIVILAFGRICSMYRQNFVFSQAFDSGALIAIASLIYFPAIVLFLAILFGLLVIRAFNWREYLIAFFGLLVPYLFVFTYYYFYDNLDGLQEELMFFKELNFRDFKMPSGGKTSVYVLFGLLLLFALPSYLLSLNHSVVRTQNLLKLVAFLFFLGIISFAVLGVNYAYVFCLISLPASIFLSIYFMGFRRQFIAEIILLIFVGTILYQHYFN